MDNDAVPVTVPSVARVVPSPSPAARTFKLTLTVVGVAAIFLLIYLCRYVLFCLFTGIVLATALRTHIARVKRLGLSHASAAALVFTASLLVIGGIVAIILPTLVGQVSRLWDETPGLYATAYERLARIESPALHRLAEMLPPTLELGTDDAGSVRNVVATTVGFLPGSTLSRGVLGTIAVLLFAFYWTLFEDRTLRSALLWIPVSTRSSVRDFIKAAQVKVGSFVRGQAWLCLIIGGLHLLTYWVLGLPYAIALGLISGMSEALPLIGPIVGAIPAILVASTIGFDKALWVVVASAVFQQLENHLLLPRIMSRSVGVNSLVTILAIAAFGVLFGVMGMILAIPLAAVLQLLLDRLLLLRESQYAEASYGRDRVSRLRLQAAELAKDARTTFCRAGAADANNDVDAPKPLEERIETIANDLSLALAVDGDNAQASIASRHVDDPQPLTTTPIPVALPLHSDPTIREFAFRCIIVGLTLTGIALIWPLRGVLLLFALSLAVAAAVRPLTEWLRRLNFPTTAAVAVSFLIAVAVVTIPLGLLVGPLSSEIYRFSDEAVVAYDHVASQPTRLAADDVEAANVAALLRDSVRNNDTDADSSVTETFFGMTFSLFGLAVEAGVVLVLSIYWTLDRDYLERLWLSLLSPERRSKVRDLVRTVEYEVGAYFRSEFLQSLAAVVLLLLGYLTLGCN